MKSPIFDNRRPVHVPLKSVAEPVGETTAEWDKVSMLIGFL